VLFVLASGFYVTWFHEFLLYVLEDSAQTLLLGNSNLLRTLKMRMSCGMDIVPTGSSRWGLCWSLLTSQAAYKWLLLPAWWPSLCFLEACTHVLQYNTNLLFTCSCTYKSIIVHKNSNLCQIL